jgi:regulator of protease activity HflC (stomatin/prohibitin superfamily)
MGHGSDNRAAPFTPAGGRREDGVRQGFTGRYVWPLTTLPGLPADCDTNEEGEAMTNFLAYIFDRLYLLWPCRIVHSYQQGVRFWLGRDVDELEPGFYFVCPFFGSIVMVDVAQDVITLPINSVTTQDGKPISFSANVVFEIASGRKKYVKVQDFETSLDALASGHLAACVRGQLWEKLLAEQDALEDEIQKRLQTAVKKWGVKIVAVHLTDMVEARAYRLFGDSPFHV